MAEPIAKFIPYGRQSLDEDDIAAVTDVLRGEYLTTGPEVAAFEADITEITGAAEAAVCSSGTAALHLALAALGIGPGDAVAVPSITFVATANAARYCGADVVFIDVDPQSGLIDPHSLDAAFEAPGGEKIRAVMPVHLGGQSADMKAVNAIARGRGAFIVEDAAHAIGTKGVPGNPDCRIGDTTYSDMAIFSFHPVKTVTSGEGGAVTMNNAALAAKIRRLRHHALSLDPNDWQDELCRDEAEDGLHPWYYETAEIGFNYRITDIQCALGRSQMRKLDQFLERRREIVTTYEEKLAPLAPLVTPITRSADCKPGWHLCPVLIDFETAEKSRADVMRALRRDGIGSQVHYVPVHMQPGYTTLYGKTALPGAEAYYKRTLSLPLYPAMSDADVDQVVAALASALNI